MGLFSSIFGRGSKPEARATVGPSLHPSVLDDPRVIFGNSFGEDSTGLNLSEGEVLGWPALVQALRLISWTIGGTPCQIFKRTPEGKSKLTAATDHPIHWLLHDEPHPEYTPFEWKSDLPFKAIFHGNSYGQIMRTRRGDVEHVFPLDTHRMESVNRVAGRLKYAYREAGGQTRIFDQSEILHVKGFGAGGILGIALQQLAPTALAKGVAMERYGARVFKNGMLSAHIVEQDVNAPKYKWGEGEEKAFYDKLSDTLTGEGNWHKVAGLPPGYTLKAMGFSAKDAQLIEGMTFAVQDIARLTGVPPSLLMDLSRATFSNVEQQMLQFLQLALHPWFTNIEQRFEKSLLTREERREYAIKFNADAILRTTLKERYEAYQLSVGRPWMSPNEARDLEDMPNIEGGDIVLEPLNMGEPGGNPDASGPDLAPPTDGESDTKNRSSLPQPCQRRECTHTSDGDPRDYRNAGRAGYLSAERRAEVRDLMRERLSLRRAFRRQIQRDASRLIKGEIREINKLAAKHLDTRDADGFVKAIEKYYQGEGVRGFVGAVNNILGDVLRSYAESMAEAVGREMGTDAPDISNFFNDYLETFSKRIAGAHFGQLRKVIEENEDAAAALARRLEEWEEEPASQAEKISGREVIQLGEAIVRTGFVVIGVTRLAWAANPGACPICEEVDGQIVGIDEVFVEASGQIDPADDDVTPLRPERDVNHPPLHQGCECSLVAA